jgi:peptidoglycan hydrolase-like protein with peptidoglycan-binding domain
VRRRSAAGRLLLGEGSSTAQAGALVLVGGLVVVVLVGCASSSLSTHPSVHPHAGPSVVAPSTTGTTPPATTQVTTTTTSPPTPAPQPRLAIGDSGATVLALQQRLTALGYWLGTPDGTFGDATQQAVYALQKVAGISRDGVVGPDTWAALDRGVLPRPSSTKGDVIEVDLESQLVLFVSNGRLRTVLNTSTGGGYRYSEDGESALALTPRGQFTIYRQVDGMVTDPLGQLWRPKFFDDGFAIHGDSFVPPYPVSHGCVRVSNEAIDWIWSQNLAPIGTALWVY